MKHIHYKPLKALFIVATLIGLSLLNADPKLGDRPVEAARSRVTPTLTWVNFYGLGSKLNGEPLPAGSRITAHDPQGVECGEFVVDTPGEYGLMPVYGDAADTPQDEGARAGDLITFRINGIAARTLGPDEPRWTENGDLQQVELEAEQAVSGATPGATIAPASPTAAPSAGTPVPPTALPATPPAGATTPPGASPTSVTAPPTSAAATASPVRTAAAGSTPISSAGSQASPTPARAENTRLAGSAIPSPTPRESPVPDAHAILGMATQTPTGGTPASATPAGSGQQARPPLSVSQTPAATVDSPTPQSEIASSGEGTNNGQLAIGAAVTLVLVTGLVLARRRFL